ncbi:hypothetical protein F2Q70_00035434 [Brassica cretica]|uniref:Uncharacterized protein n=1 Tax=Brassica cretica TaxID=69181 RepID=A0A8S9JPQ7_BRACR|nr:hypothetical protein F2Q70_00035434 [Brassica cretica]
MIKLKLVTYPVKVKDGSKGTLSFSYRFNPVAPLDDMSPSAPDYSLWFGQPVHPTPDPASSGHPVYLNTDPARLGQPVYLNTDPARSGQPVYLNPDPDSVWTDPRFYYPDSDPGTPDILFSERIRSGSRIESGSRIISPRPSQQSFYHNHMYGCLIK